MKIEVTESYDIRIQDAYNPVIFETEEGEKLVVCMRDGGFEVGTKDNTWYGVHGGKIEELGAINEPKNE